MSKGTIGGKTKSQWILYLLRAKHVAELLLDSIKDAEEAKDKEAVASIYELYDAILNIIVLAEFVIDHNDWKEKKTKIQ